MERGLTKVFCGDGKGKSTASLGRAIVCAGAGKTVFLIQFLKGKHEVKPDYLSRLEPELRVFSFEKMDRYYEELTEEEKQEENFNIKNGINFARKVLRINECDLLILDEVLGLVDLGIISDAEIKELIESKPEGMELVLTGRNLPESLTDCVDYISQIGILKDCPEVFMR